MATNYHRGERSGSDLRRYDKEQIRIRNDAISADMQRVGLGKPHCIGVVLEKGIKTSRSGTITAFNKYFITKSIPMPIETVKYFKSMDEYKAVIRSLLDAGFEDLASRIQDVDSHKTSPEERDMERWDLARFYNKTLVDTFRAYELKTPEGNIKPFDIYFKNGGSLSLLVAFQITQRTSSYFENNDESSSSSSR